MASNNYTAANVTPSSDTFREWVDLTNRITYDMEKRVVTTAQHTVGGGTTGNAYVNGFFSANTLMITDSIQGVSTDDSSNIVGANSALANLIFSTNATFIANSTHYSHINAQANVHISGGLLNVDANVDIDNADTNINATAFLIKGTTANLDSTTSAINGTTLDINSTNVDVDTANAQVNATAFFLEGTTANIESTTLTVNGTLLDINSNVDIDAVTVTVDGGTMTVGSMINANANVDINNALTDITSTDTNISGSNVTIDSTHVDIHGTSLDINSNTNIDGDVTLTANAVVGNANTDLLTVNSNTVLTDKLNVQKAVDFDDVLNVDGAATFNADITLGDANTDSVNFIAEVSSNIIPESNTQALGLDDSRWVLQANTINASGNVTAQADVDVAGEANVNTLRVVTDASIEGNTTLGNASSDLVTFTARSSSIEPSANGNDLGTATKRWDLNANGVNVANHAHFNSTMNVESDSTFGTDIDVSSEANTNTLRVRSTSKLEGFANAVQSIGVGANVHVGANVYIRHGNTDGLTTISDSNITIGNSTVNTAITTGGVDTDGSLAVLGAATLSSTLGVGGATSLGSTLNTTGSARFQSTANVDGLLRAKAGLITTGTANASVAMNIGANVNLSTSKVTVGNSTSNTTITKAAIDTDGQLIVAGNTTVGGDVDITGEVNAASAAIVGGAVVGGALDVNNTADFLGNVNFQDSITVADNSTFSKTLAAGNTSITGTLSTSGKATLASANVTGALQANGAVDFNSTGDFAGNVNFQDSITVADNSTFSKTLAAGNTTVTGFVNASGNIKAASANVSGHANLATIGASGAVALANTLGVTGLGTFGSGISVTGTANTTTAIHVGSFANTKVRLANNTIAVGNTGANSKLTSTTISTTGTLTVSNTAALGTTTITGDASITANLAATYANVGGLNSTGSVDFDSTLNVDGNVTLNEDVDLGSASDDTVSFAGRVDTSLEPSATGKVLGHASRRWALAAQTINSSGSAIIGGGLAVSATTNSTSNTTGTITSAGGLGVAKSVTFGENLKVHGNTDIDGTHIYLGSNSSVISNSSFTTITANKSILDDLIISDSFVLPSNSVLSYAQGIIQELDVTANASFSTGANVVVDFGGDPTGKATVNLTNAHFTNTMALDHRLQVGTFSSGSSGTQANTTAVESDNIYARNDLIANYSSDQRLKDKVIKIDTALDKVDSLSGYQFEWNKHIEDFRVGTIDYGVIAQELEKVLPHAVDINNRGYKTVNYNSLIPLLIEAVKELSSRVKELEGEK